MEIDPKAATVAYIGPIYVSSQMDEFYALICPADACYSRSVCHSGRVYMYISDEAAIMLSCALDQHE